MAGTGTLLGTVGGGVVGGLFGGPLGAGLGMSAGSLLGGYLDGAYDDPAALDPYQVDPSLYDTSGYGSISDAAKQRAAAAQDRTAPTTDWSMANQDRGLSMETRGRQMGLANDIEAFLRGEKSSLAQQQLASGMQRVNAEAANSAANVRGGAGNQLLAAEEARRAAQGSQLELNRQQGELRAQEEAAARGQLASLLGQTRGQDLGQRGQSQDQAQFVTQTEMQQRAANDRAQQFYDSLRLQAEQGASQAKQAQGAAQQNAAGQVLGINAQREQDAQQGKRDLVAGASSGGSALAQMGMSNGNAWSQPGTSGGGGGAPPTDEEWAAAWGSQPGSTSQDQWDTAWQQSGGRKWW